jgi:phosphatidylserine/phosphatidylglycerophosphate/cardiolipin synthase-like enzyme
MMFELYAYDKILFLPQDNKDAVNTIVKLIKNSKNSIDIAMYNLSYKKFIKALNKQAKKGIDINIFYEKSDKKFHQNIKLFKTSKKLHTKIAVFDKKILVFGSANWKKKSFTENYEILNITNDVKKIKKVNNFLKKLKDNK